MSLHLYCTECPGTYGYTALPGVSIDSDERGYLGMQNVPPSGVVDRDPEAVVEAAAIWNHLLLLKPANGLCPRCSASLDTSANVCTDHDTSEGLCEECGCRHSVGIEHRCTNWIFNAGGFFADWLLTNFEFVALLVAHDVNPVSPTPDVLNQATSPCGSAEQTREKSCSACTLSETAYQIPGPSVT